MKEKLKGLLLCLVIAVPAWLLGRKFAVVGGPVISILLGMIVGLFLKNRAPFEAGIKFTSKKILQWAVILLGFGMNLATTQRRAKLADTVRKLIAVEWCAEDIKAAGAEWLAQTPEDVLRAVTCI